MNEPVTEAQHPVRSGRDALIVRDEQDRHPVLRP
jgi:hypothetical protein